MTILDGRLFMKINRKQICGLVCVMFHRLFQSKLNLCVSVNLCAPYGEVTKLTIIVMESYVEKNVNVRSCVWL